MLQSNHRDALEGFDQLQALALDLRWSWDHSTDKMWRQLDPELWDLTHNPWVILQTVSKEKLETILADPHFRKILENHVEVNKLKCDTPAWFQQNYPESSLSCVAYFSMEFMLSEALPIYSGGLGNVAGDQLKAASDLGLPVVAVGLLYQQGYFRQVIDNEGNQEALYPYNDPGQLPIQPLLTSNGELFRLKVSFPGWALWVRVWHVKVGRVKLYLLDTNDPANFPEHRTITAELYGGGREMRLRQELLLGIGGCRLLEALDIKPDVFHLNECHSAFVVLERAYQFMKQSGHSFEEALTTTRAGNLFTTHTAVPAGFDCFSPELLESYLSHYVKEKLKISFEELLALGRLNPKDRSETFNMAYLAIRGSGAVNAVSRLHGNVSRQIFNGLFPRWPQEEVPVGSVTNGIHVSSWDSAAADDLWTESCGKSRWLGETEYIEKEISQISDEKIWNMRNNERSSLIDFARERLARQWAAQRIPFENYELAKNLFNPEVLTLGFARRFATYKRPDLLLHHPERLIRLLTNKQRPVQLILAGKAHPADKEGQAMIQKWIQFIKKPEVRPHVIFLSDYDMLLTERLIQGVDVWLNTPRRPWEACGTSGMKVLVNGGLNLSELDGWWAEAYTPEVGWALGDGQEHENIQTWDAIEAAKLYELLEQSVIPEFYSRDKNGIPVLWIARIRSSMAKLTPYFSANRAVREYTQKYYLPCASNYQKRAANQGFLGKELNAKEKNMNKNWASIQFGPLKVISNQQKEHSFEVEVFLNMFDPKEVAVQLFANGIEPLELQLQDKEKIHPVSHMYGISIPATRPASDYTLRIIPKDSDAIIPLEMNQILWQH